MDFIPSQEWDGSFPHLHSTRQVDVLLGSRQGFSVVVVSFADALQVFLCSIGLGCHIRVDSLPGDGVMDLVQPCFQVVPQQGVDVVSSPTRAVIGSEVLPATVP